MSSNDGLISQLTLGKASVCRSKCEHASSGGKELSHTDGKDGQGQGEHRLHPGVRGGEKTYALLHIEEPSISYCHSFKCRTCNLSVSGIGRHSLKRLSADGAMAIRK